MIEQTQLRPFALERYFARHEFSARYLLGSSDPESMSVGDLLAFEPGAEEDLKKLWLGYTESLGDPELREEISRHYRQVQPEQILVFTGAEEPIFAFMHAVLNHGDHLIVHFPGYQSHYAVAESRGIGVTRWPGDPKTGWAPDVEQLESLITSATRAILICTPHNPTGYLFNRHQWEMVIEVARKHDLWVFCDEVYRGTEHDPATRLPQMADHYEKGISLNCLSKNCGLAGLRIGWIATRDAHVYRNLATFKDYLTICNSAPGEFLARIALRHCDEIFARQRLRLVKNLDQLASFFGRFPELFTWQRPMAGTTTFPEFLGGDALAFCDRLVAETGVMLIPGTFFDMQKQYLRFGYGRAGFSEALRHLESWLMAAK